MSILGRLNDYLAAISLWWNAEDGKRFVDLFFKEKQAAVQQGLYQNREAKLRNIRLAINKLNLIMESQNGAVVGYYGIRLVLPTGEAENNSSTGFTAACAAFYLSYPILSLSAIALVSFCAGYYGFNYFFPVEPEISTDTIQKSGLTESTSNSSEVVTSIDIPSNELITGSVNLNSGSTFIVCITLGCIPITYFDTICTYVVNIPSAVVHFMKS